jgi:hypothetical protein
MLSPAMDAADSHGLAELLRLAAAPAFAIMALFTALSGDAAPAVLCGPMRGDGMALMYLLMSIFHAAPWLILLTSHRR